MSTFGAALTEALRTGNRRTMTPVERILHDLDAESRADCEAALADPTIPHRVMHDALKAMGVKVSRETLSNYRNNLFAAADTH